MKIFGCFYRPVVILSATTLVSGSLLAAAMPGTAVIRKITDNNGAGVGVAMIDAALAKVGDIARAGSVVSAGHNSKVYLFLGVNGPGVNVLSDGRLVISELTYEDGPETIAHTSLLLQSGHVEGDVKKTSSKSTFLVTTPTTTAAIRGTKFSITTSGAIFVWEGVVEIKVNGQTIAVSAGQVYVPAGASIAPTMAPAAVAAVMDIPANTVVPEPAVFTVLPPSAANQAGVAVAASGNFKTPPDSQMAENRRASESSGMAPAPTGNGNNGNGNGNGPGPIVTIVVDPAVAPVVFVSPK